MLGVDVGCWLIVVGELPSALSFHKVAPQRGWDTLLSSSLSNEVHRFTPLPWTGQVVDKGLKDMPMDMLFMPQPRSLPESLRQIVGVKAKTEWTTTAPNMAPCEREDLHLASHCLENNTWEEGPASWQCCLSNGKNLCLRHVSWPANDYVFSLGSVGGTSALGWPAQNCPADLFVQFYRPDMTKDLVPIVITKPEEWEGFFYEWKSPLGVAAALNRWDPGCYGAAKAGKVLPLMKLAAFHGFWDFKRTTLNLFLSHHKVPHDKTAPLHEVLLKLVEKFYPEVTDEDKLRILRSRAKRRDDVAAFLATPEAQELIDKSDAQQIKDSIDGGSSAAKHEQISLKTSITKLAVATLGGDDAVQAASGRGNDDRC